MGDEGEEMVGEGDRIGMEGSQGDGREEEGTGWDWIWMGGMEGEGRGGEMKGSAA